MEGTRREILHAYEVYIPTNTSMVEEVFWVLLAAMLALFLGFGAYMKTVKRPVETLEKKVEAIRTRFVIEEKKPAPKPAPPKPEAKKPAEKPAPKEEKPLDLRNNPTLAQKVDDAAARPQAGAAVAPRRVYGLRRVFAVGIGAQGGAGDAVIGKLGNTLNTSIDTFTATRADLKGTLVPVTTVTVAPRLIKQAKPEYTKEMLDAKIEGVIKADILIDIDGTVKEIRILNDLGLGTRESALAALKQMEFEPAKRGSDAVAVWITFSIRFVLLQ